jgi:hypothetical protein
MSTNQFVQEDFTLLFKQDQTAEAALQRVVAGTMVRFHPACPSALCPSPEQIN